GSSLTPRTFDVLPGNLIQINLKPQPNGLPPKVATIWAIPASRGTFGVARTPGRDDVAFTNAQTDVAGVEVLDQQNGQKNVIGLSLDARDLPADDPVSQTYYANPG